MYPIINDKLKNSPYKICLAVTGGGTGVIDKLLKYGGGSSTLLDAYVPYDIDRLNKFLKLAPEKCCSIGTARAMAMEAFNRAQVDNDQATVLGVGATCKLRKVVNERQGREHTIHIAVQGLNFTESFDFILGPTAKTIRIREMGRIEEEDLCTDTIMMCIAIASGIPEYKKPLLEIYGDDFTHIRFVDHIGAKDVLFGNSLAVSWYNKPPAPCMFSGSFNPIHEGHIEMIKIAKKKYGTVDLELSIKNVDKYIIDYHEILTRVAKILKYGDLINNIWITNLPMFSDKGKHFPNTTFIIGGDTLLRLDDDKYYVKHKFDDKYYVKHKRFTFASFNTNNIKFLVFNRNTYDIKSVSKDLMNKCTIVNKKEYTDKGISSTQKREKNEIRPI